VPGHVDQLIRPEQRLFLPESWDTDAERRRKAHVPAGEGHRPK
jgi:hypothetical protein